MNPDSDNHLGSSTFLTDAAGEPYQFVMYLPFGETFTEQRAAGFGTPYLFNAKELDEETGLYYYGARYYDPRASIWISVDPLADHPNQIGMSPYSAFWSNPIVFTDPDGRCPDCPDPSTAKEGDIVNPNGGMDFIFTNGEWTGVGGTLNEVTVTASRTENYGGLESGNAQSGESWGTTLGGAALNGGAYGMYNNNDWRSLSQGKQYSQRFHGNQYVTDKGLARNASRGLTGVGYGLGLYNGFRIEQQYSEGQINQAQRWTEQGSNVISTFGGIYGAAWGIGWELGRAITNIPGYHENVRLPVQQFLGIVPPKQECILCPK